MPRCKWEINPPIQDFINWARFLAIPIGNIPSDTVQMGLDVLLARHLDRAGHVSWASAAARPDLGGKEVWRIIRYGKYGSAIAKV